MVTKGRMRTEELQQGQENDPNRVCLISSSNLPNNVDLVTASL